MAGQTSDGKDREEGLGGDRIGPLGHSKGTGSYPGRWEGWSRENDMP